jgi:hypothetical protein
MIVATRVDHELAGRVARMAAYRGGITQGSDHVLFRDSIQFYWTALFPTLGGQDVAQVTGSMGPS